MDGEFVSMTDAARRLNISRMLIGRRVRSGDLPFYEDPLETRKKLIRTADVEALRRPRPARQEQLAEVSAA